MHSTARCLFQAYQGNIWTGFSETESSFAFISLEVGNLGSPSHIGKAKLDYLLTHGISPAQTEHIKTAIHIQTHFGTSTISLHGDSVLILIRDNNFTQIKQSSSGQFCQGDILIFCTQDFLHSSSWETLKTNLSVFSVDDLERHISTHEKNPLVVILQINQLDLAKKTHPIGVVPAISPIAKKNPRLLFLLPVWIFLIALIIRQVSQNFFYNQSKLQLEDILTKAEGIYPLSPTSAKTSALEAQEILTRVKQQKIESWQTDFESRINRLISVPIKTEKNQSDHVSNQENSTTPSSAPSSLGDAQPFFDAATISPDSNYSRLAYQDGKLILLDTVAKRLDSLALENKEPANILKNNSLEKIQLLATTSAGIYLGSSSNLYKADSSGISSLLKFSSEKNTIAPSSLAFWNNALYVLDNQNRQIYKYTPNSKGFDLAQPWLKADQKLESDTIGIAIDTNLYQLSKTNLVSQFAKGERVDFGLTGTTGVDNPTHFSVPVGGDKIILVASNKAYIFNKDGKLNKIYSLGDTIPLDIAFFDNTLYILETNQKIIKLVL